MRTKTLWLWLALLLTSLALVAAGCGGDDDEAAGTGATTEDGGGNEAAEQVITVNWGGEPPSLDPGLATDTTSANILLNIMDPLVKLDEDLNPVPSAAERFETSEDGKTVTFTLRDDIKWTNGDPVTAQDFEYAWKRTVSPELGADYAYQFSAIAGADEYNSCDPKKDDCEALAEKMGVKAVDDKTLEVTLKAPTPWFLQQVAHHSFLAVNKKAVDQFGEKWTEAANIVTNGPFKLERWQHNANIDLVKWDEWRDADSVKLTRVNGRMISDGVTAVQAFEAGEIDVNEYMPTEEIARLRETPEYEQYPALGTYYEGFNVTNIPDVKQRRAMSLAINRRSIIDNIAQEDQIPATGFTPEGMPGYDVINPDSPWMPEEGDIEQAKQLMSEVANPVKDITFYVNDSPGHRDIAVAIQAVWEKELGIKSTIKQQEFQQYLEFLGPPPNKDVDVYRLGWIGDFVDAINFLELWMCESGNNNTNYCNEEYDAKIEEARTTEDNDARYELYGEAEDILFGENGDMPVIPIYYYTTTAQERESVKESVEFNLLTQLDLTKVVVKE